eukprot:1158880-Pelagomonas_calceolata.AAC.4
MQPHIRGLLHADIINLELALADLGQIEKRLDKLKKGEMPKCSTLTLCDDTVYHAHQIPGAWPGSLNINCLVVTTQCPYSGKKSKEEQEKNEMEAAALMRIQQALEVCSSGSRAYLHKIRTCSKLHGLHAHKIDIHFKGEQLCLMFCKGMGTSSRFPGVPRSSTPRGSLLAVHPSHRSPKSPKGGFSGRTQLLRSEGPNLAILGASTTRNLL